MIKDSSLSLTHTKNKKAKEDKNVIDPSGIELLFCHHLNLHIEDPVLLVLAWKMNCKQMGYFTLKEWLKGFSELQCDSLNKIKAKIDYLRQFLFDSSSFKSIYRFSFGFSKVNYQLTKLAIYLSFSNFLSLSKGTKSTSTGY